MGLTNFPNGVTSFGIPQIGSDGLIPTSTGSYFFVDSTTGNSGNTGDTPTDALATIDQAINKCTASKGDVIIVMPGHAETIADATTLVPDVAGITIVGLGNATDQPEITFSATGSQIIVTGASTVLRNLRFVAGISAIDIGVNVDANNVTIEGCTFTFSTTAYDFVIGVDIDAYDYCTVRNCVFDAETATAGALSGVQLDDANNCIIDGNYFSGDFSDSAIANPAADALGTKVLITNNYIYNDDTASASNGIQLQNAYTGLIARNVIGSLQATNVFDAIDAGSCLNVENYACNAVDEVGILAGSSTAST